MFPHLAPLETPRRSGVRHAVAPTGRRVAVVVTAVATAAAAVVTADPALSAPVPARTFTSQAATFQAGAVVNVADDYTRSVRAGLGSAARGGRYTTQIPQSRYSVRSGAATISRLDPKVTRGFALRSVSSTSQRLRLEFSVPKLGRAGNGTTVIVALRTLANGDAYRAQLRVTTGGRLRLSVAKKLRGGGNVFGNGEVAVPGSARSGRHVIVDGLVLGTSTVNLAVRAWVRGAREPGWQLSRTDSHPGRLGTVGHVGVYFRRAAKSGVGRAKVFSLKGWTGGRGYPSKSTTEPKPTPKPTPKPEPKPTPTTPTTPAPTSTPTETPTTPAPSDTPTETPTTPAPSDTPTETPTTPAPSDSPTDSPTTPPPSSGTTYHTTDGAAPGSLPVGAARYAVPANAIFVSPTGNDTSGDGSLQRPFAKLSRAVTAAQAGSTIVMRGGSYNEYAFVKKAVTIQNYPGEAVWLDGSIPVTGWTKTAAGWVHGNWNYEFDSSASFSKGSNAGGFINPKYPLAAHPDQVFYDNQPLVQVASNPGAGQFAVDYNADTITVGSNPSGRAVSASNLQQALTIGPGNTIVRGIGVRNYATSLWQMGTVYIGGKDGHTTLQNVVVTNNATEGIALFSHHLLLDHVTSQGNGMTGIEVSQSNNSVVQNTVIDQNNRENFNTAPATAGIKIHRSDDFTVKNSVISRNNQAVGIWTDINVTHFYFIGNDVVNNGDSAFGILAELSSHGIVADNRISGSEAGFTAMDSADIKVFNNTLWNNKLWDLGTYQDQRYVPGKSTQPSWITPTPDNPWIVQNVVFSNNDMSQSTATFQLHPMDYQTNRSADEMSLTVDGNLFRSGNVRMIGWGKNDNKTTTNYGTVAAFQAAKNSAWRNAETRMQSRTLTASDAQSFAVPIPADVATTMGVPAGTKRVGATW